MSATRLSDDGLFYWDGQRWVSTWSPDGRYRWNGTAWMPVTAVSSSAYGYPIQPAYARAVTSLTKPMQLAVAGWFLVQALWFASLPFWYINTMTQYADSMNRREQQLNPGAPTPPPDMVSNINTQMTVLFYLAIVVFLAVATVAIIGALRRWTWAFYAILALLALEVLFVVLGLIETVATDLATSSFFGQSLGPPNWQVAVQIGFAVPSAALFVWMLGAVAQKGPWAMNKVVAGTTNR
jgi:hypothetical protein